MVQADGTYVSPYSQQWLFSPAHLHVTPSSQDNTISLTTELQDRKAGVELIVRICERLPSTDPKYRTEARALENFSEADHRQWELMHMEYQSMPRASYVHYAASTFLHRFYMRFALQDFPIQHIAATCVYLALKTEEVMKVKLRSLAQATKYELGYEHDDTKKYIGILTENEDYLLEALCYDLAVEQPQSILINAHNHLEYAHRKRQAQSMLQNRTSGSSTMPSKAAMIEKSTSQPVNRSKLQSVMSNDVDMDMDLDDETDNTTSRAPKETNGEQHTIESDEANMYLLDLATEILHGTMTTPLTLLSRAHIIAASVYAIAWATLKSQSLADTLFRLTTAIGDEWEEAFVPQDGVKPICKNGDFERDTRDCCALILEFHHRGLMDPDILDAGLELDVLNIHSLLDAPRPHASQDDARLPIDDAKKEVDTSASTDIPTLQDTATKATNHE